MDMIRNRLKKNLNKRLPQIKQQQLKAYRLYDKDIPEYPFLIDIYHGPEQTYALVYEKGLRSVDESIKSQHHLDVLNSLQELLGIPQEAIIFKERKKQENFGQYQKINETVLAEIIFPVQEGAHAYLVNLSDYLDTGLFLDHRPLRRMMPKFIQEAKSSESLQGSSQKNNAAKGEFLNLFAYTGTMSVVAAAAGMRTTTIDLSNTYLDWAKQNFILNQLDFHDDQAVEAHRFIRSDIMQFLQLETSAAYDVIFLDPPSFSRSKKMLEIFEIQADHQFLIEKCMARLKLQGQLIFSTNLRSFQLAAAISEKFKVTEISYQTVPFDFQDKKIHRCFVINHKS